MLINQFILSLFFYTYKVRGKNSPLEFWSSATNMGSEKIWGWCGSGQNVTDEVLWEARGEQNIDMCATIKIKEEEIMLTEQSCNKSALFICEVRFFV
jgi:hypothetical protein